MYAEVLVEYGVKSLDKTFTYIIPDTLKDKLQVGMKVIVPFGNQKINGFVINIKDEENYDKLKEIIKISNEDLILNEELLELGLYLKEKTLCTLITAYNTMFPSSLKIKTITTNYNLYNIYINIKDENKAKEFILNNKRSIKKIELINKLLNKELVLKKEYNNYIINELLEKNIISLKYETKYRLNKEKIKEKKFKLTKEQEVAINRVDLNNNGTYLIHGVTGSGKTEVYMNLIEKVISNGKTAIMLVPEISLTTQIVNRFYNRFGFNVAIFHSGLSDGERHDEYKKIINGEVKIVVGTRSAIFTPLKNIGILIIDEEHSTNYKQENNPRYNTIDIALKRSEYHEVPLVLGSATPSLEAYARALKGNYQLITMKNRIGSSKIPKINIVDMNLEAKKRNMIISDELDKKIKERLKNKEQIMIFLNRRGFNTIVNCINCNYTFKCPNCEISLTYHKSTNNLRCHYCGYTIFKPEVCPSCTEKALTSYGLGTEKLEETIKEKYPEARIIRMDADTTTRKGAHENIIKKIENEEVDILIGTQMISKGLDFPKVTLVGVINADESLNIPDFRSGEYTFSLLNQVSGRAGRSNLEGEVIIQTFNPDNQIINFVKESNYLNLFKYEMNIRKLLSYPPYYYLTILKIASKDYNKASIEANKISDYLNKNLTNTIILGPTTAGMFKINNIYRFQIILKYKNFDYIKEALKYIDSMYITDKNISIEIDVNPVRI
ncbi:MAG: primosomal protein N' [Bacilli bacterium]|nr:primosomal protein N' [Bacilli bacterium]MDD4406464.1 primosomal protein N' [Bacilli bacterium]